MKSFKFSNLLFWSKFIFPFKGKFQRSRILNGGGFTILGVIGDDSIQNLKLCLKFTSCNCCLFSEVNYDDAILTQQREIESEVSFVQLTRKVRKLKF